MTVACAGDRIVLESIKMAAEMGIIEPILVGNKKEILKLLNQINYDFRGTIVNTSNKQEAAYKTMELIAQDKADFPMRGFLSSSIILRAMLNKDFDFRQNKLLSVSALIYLKKKERFIIITDTGMNISPDLSKKVEMINNSVELAQSLGIDKPKVAVIGPAEKVNVNIPSTVDAAILAKMSDRGQIKEAIVDGPLAFDNAILKESAEHKGINSFVAGEADILILPDLNTANVLYKSLVVYSGLESGAVVLGARLPLAMSSRADDARTKFNGIVLSKIIVSNQKN